MGFQYCNTMKEAGELIRKRRGDKSLAEVSRLSGVREDYLRLEEEGENILYPEEEQALCDALGLFYPLVFSRVNDTPVWEKRDDRVQE